MLEGKSGKDTVEVAVNKKRRKENNRE